jgi:DNA-binding Lrp family transcriptional regulator
MSDTEREIVRKNLTVLQNPLPLTPEPFAGYADSLNCSQEAIFEILCDYLANGIVRRIAGVLKHDKAGFTDNAMVAIEIPYDECDSAGAALAQFSFITHCYRRTSYPDWPYTMYAMVHAKNTDELSAHIEQMIAKVSCKAIIVLKSLKEYKKTTFRI